MKWLQLSCFRMPVARRSSKTAADCSGLTSLMRWVKKLGRQLVGIHHHLLHMYALQGREHDVSAVTSPYKTLVLQQPAQMLRS